MSWSKKLGLAFIHIPKAAGTSILKTLSLEPLFYGHRAYHYHPKWEDPNYTFFTIVRNPLSRAVSAYEFIKMDESSWYNEDNPHRLKKIYDNLSFPESINVIKECLSRKDTYKAEAWYPQYKWICDDKRNIMVENILRFENLQEDLNQFLEERNLPPTKLEFWNVSKKVNYMDYYDDTTLEQTYNIYKDDFELFNYSI